MAENRQVLNTKKPQAREINLPPAVENLLFHHLRQSAWRKKPIAFDWQPEFSPVGHEFGQGKVS